MYYRYLFFQRIFSTFVPGDKSFALSAYLAEL
jgi:hypothetical protein